MLLIRCKYVLLIAQPAGNFMVLFYGFIIIECKIEVYLSEVAVHNENISLERKATCFLLQLISWTGLNI